MYSLKYKSEQLPLGKVSLSIMLSKKVSVTKTANPVVFNKCNCTVSVSSYLLSSRIVNEKFLVPVSPASQVSVVSIKLKSLAIVAELPAELK